MAWPLPQIQPKFTVWPCTQWFYIFEVAHVLYLLWKTLWLPKSGFCILTYEKMIHLDLHLACWEALTFDCPLATSPPAGKSKFLWLFNKDTGCPYILQLLILQTIGSLEPLTSWDHLFFASEPWIDLNIWKIYKHLISQLIVKNILRYTLLLQSSEKEI